MRYDVESILCFPKNLPSHCNYESKGTPELLCTHPARLSAGSSLREFRLQGLIGRYYSVLRYDNCQSTAVTLATDKRFLGTEAREAPQSGARRRRRGLGAFGGEGEERRECRNGGRDGDSGARAARSGRAPRHGGGR